MAVFEALRYPGGCASTFTRGGVQYEAGATLFSGLGEGQLFDVWRRELDLKVDFSLLSEPITLRAPGLTLSIPADREALVARLCALPGAPVKALRAFFAEQRAVADALWPIFDDPTRLPPLRWQALGWHAGRAWRYLPLLRLMGKPLLSVLARHGLAGWSPLRTYLDAICQITVQADVATAEAPFAMATMDYCARGTGHVHGGIGALAWALWRALSQRGAQMHLSSRVQQLRRTAAGDAWQVTTRTGTVRAPLVLANLLPQAVQALLPDHPLPRLAAQSAAVARGWGAAMLYQTVRADAVSASGPHHLELVADPRAPFVEGNHIFCSISGADEVQRAPAGQRTVTISTHVPMATLRGQAPSQQGAYIAGVQDTMRATLRALAPEVAAGTLREMTASPRTWARFTRRPEGLVGGIPRQVGWANYQGLWPQAVAPGLFLVGDSVFPGQSTLATALGGVRTARAALSGHSLFAA